MEGRTRTIRRGAATVLVAVLAATVGATTAAPSGAVLPACTRTWAAAVSGSWSDASRWAEGTVPSATDHVCIFGPGPFTVTIDGAPTVEVASVRASAGSGLVDLHVGAGSSPTTTFLVHEELDIGQGTRLVLGSPDAGSATVAVRTDPDGTIDLRGEILATGDGDPDLDLRVETGEMWIHESHPHYPPDGTLRVEHPLSVTAASVRIDGAVDLTAPLAVAVEGRVWFGSGTIATAGPGSASPVMTVDGTLRLGSASVEGPDRDGGQVLVTDGGAIEFLGDGGIGVAVAGEVAVSGTVPAAARLLVNGRADGTDAHVRFTGSFTNAGEIVLGDDQGAVSRASVGSDDGGTFVNHGSVTIGAAGGAGQVSQILADVTNRGHLRLDDPLELLGDLRNDGTLDLGSEELLVRPGDVVLSRTGEVVTAISPEAGGFEAGRLVTDAVAVAGALRVVTAEAAPPIGGTERVITTGSRSGTFADVRYTGSASYDMAYGPGRVDVVRRASESASRRFVRAAHQDFLGRQPTPTELAQQAAALDAGTVGRASIVRVLSRAPEYISVLVQRFYMDTLKRPGGPDEVAYWVEQLRSGRQDVPQVAAGFYASAEYIGGQAQNRTDLWVHRLYVVFFEREPIQEIEGQYWVDRVRARGYRQVAKELFQSLESRRQRVHRVYGDLLGRAGDPGGVDYWAGRITREGDLALAVHLAASGEYLARSQSRYP